MMGSGPERGSMTVERLLGSPRLGLHVSPVGEGAGCFGGCRVAALVSRVLAIGALPRG